MPAVTDDRRAAGSRGQAAQGRPPLGEETACAVCERREYRTISNADRNGRPLCTVMCDLCGLVWTNPRPSSEDIDRYYATEYRADYTRNRAPTVRKILRGMLGAEERRRQLAHLVRADSRVLDVGCGAGEFVYLLRCDAVDAFGIEPGEEYADFSRRVLEIPIQTATVDRAVVEPGSQDLITMFHMLEHVADPRRTLATIRDWLREEGGVLVVEVPSVDSTVQAPRHRFHYAHLYNFNASTLGALGEAVGLRLLRSYHSDDGGNVTCVFGRGGEGGHRVTGLPENVARTRQILRNHTAAGHYLSATPYRRALIRLGRRWRENRLLRQLRTVEGVLEWATRNLARAPKSRLH